MAEENKINDIFVFCANKGDKVNLEQQDLDSKLLDEGTVTVVERDFSSSERCSQFDFDLSTFFKKLRSKHLGKFLLYSDRVTSTQTLMLGPLKDLEVNTVFTATRQVSGKGRGKNVWESPLGCLMFSLKCSTTRAVNLPFFQYLVSLVIVQAIKIDPLHQALDVRIKWPNDIYGNGEKIGGIICSSSFINGKYEIVVGTGINVCNEKPTTCLNEMLTEMDIPSDQHFTREGLLAEIINGFDESLFIFESEGFAPFQSRYLSNWLHSDQVVKVTNEDGTVEEMTVKGLTESGYLKALNELGEIRQLHPDGNTFDFFEGLISRKVK